MECVVDTALRHSFYGAIGFAFMFSHGNGFIGFHWFFLRARQHVMNHRSRILSGVGCSSFAFADTCSTIDSLVHDWPHGFVGDLLQLAVSGFIYPIYRSPGPGAGWLLATMGSEGTFLLR